MTGIVIAANPKILHSEIMNCPGPETADPLRIDVAAIMDVAIVVVIEVRPAPEVQWDQWDNESIVYLPEPVPAPTDCCADCETTIRSLLPVGTPNVNIVTSTQPPSLGTVIENEYGMIVLANEAGTNITFISSCKIDLFII